MRAVLGIAAGAVMIAAGLGYFPDLEGLPLAMAVIFTLFGALLIYAAAYHGVLRMRRRRAYDGGRERRGTARLLKPADEDDATAYLLFANSHSEWLMSVEMRSISSKCDALVEGTAAKAYLGEDDRIYALEIGDARALPISPGVPFEGKLRERIERVGRKEAEWVAWTGSSG
ncbi:hypothetical protein P8Q88_13820 [Qipengyuania sp. XHP0207]|uniref:hypothetical protein n=1 Tax=Qipengyuania sp. XHP0207 TaxID=3038078 RepID=UPI00241E8EDB|nr:hypothetical protein [Qipengyuania sp. XHP0207]MDG5749255.1 hypothetical protein [Qipengyuania sp. XHP0207]